MTYFGMPFSMWTLFAGSFQKQLTAVFGYDVRYGKSHHEKSKTEIQRDHLSCPNLKKRIASR